MRLLRILPLLLLPVACATPPHLVATGSDTVMTVPEVADQLATADVVSFGEMHDTPPVHTMHHALLTALHQRRGDMVIAMEMFERDVQTVLLKYLNGFVDERTFLEQARPWPNYERDYRPVVEFAKRHGLVVLAANAPRPLASRVAKEGIAAVAGNPHVARETTAPEDDYWHAFQEQMLSHPGVTPAQVKNFYAAQCLKDDTMAESVCDHLQQRRLQGGKPLVVVICGSMHSDHGRGTVARIRSRMPDLDVRVLSAEAVADIGSGVYASARTVADYVVVVPGAAPAAVEEEKAVPVAAAPAAVAVPVVTPPAAASPAAPPAPAANESGLRPALGLMPDYAESAQGVLVGQVREGGAADKAGIEAGDLIIKVGGVEVADVESYTEALDAQKIGSTIMVRVRRSGVEVELPVVVGSRPAR
ncbi:MAG: ChaN family lipoprotein [Planctomycetes bacterium]|jgi:uncharacterized iron-regulated protein|nr:ChaN family lipoprotein [Planctomycetota bacterium]